VLPEYRHFGKLVTKMNTNDDDIYAKLLDFGDGAPALHTGGHGIGTTAEHPPGEKHKTAKPGLVNSNPAALFGLGLTVLGQGLLAATIAAGGDPLIGTVGTVGLAGFGLGFALVGADTGTKEKQ
jgi:hypothetical protein